MILGCLVILLAPLGIQPLHLHGDAVGMQVAVAEDDYLLLRAAVPALLLKQIGAHGCDSLGNL
jgi:hypothetical protein